MAKDPYKYFRLEARELVDGLTQGVIELEKGPFVADMFSKLLRLAHTLKGAARVVKQPRIAEVAHEMEDVLSSLRDAAATPTAEQAATLLRQLDEINARVRQLDPAPPVETPQPARPAAAEEPIETVRVELQEMDALLRDVTEAGVQLGALRRTLGALDRLQELAKLLHEQLGPRSGEQGALRPAAAIRARIVAKNSMAKPPRCRSAITENPAAAAAAR